MRKAKQTTLDYARVYSFAIAWVKLQKRNFTSEDLKQAFYSDDNHPLDNPNVFGNVFTTLAKNKAIFKNGYAAAKLGPAHGRLLNMWISLEYSNQQAQNRSNPKSEQLSLLQ